MAVQAQYISNAFSPDLHSRVQIGGVLEGLQMLQSRDNQIGQFLHTPHPAAFIRDAVQVPAGLTNATVLSDHPQSDLTCNASSSRKRNRDEPIISIASPIYQQLCVLNSATAASIRPGTVASPSGFHISSGLSFPVSESAAPSTSDRPAGFSTVSLLPFVPAFSPELLALLNQQNIEMDAFLRQQRERLRLGIEEAQKRHCRELISALAQRAVKRLREKEAELENASRRNAELEEKARQISAESLIWFNLAKNNEAVVSSLKTSLEQAMIQNTAAAPPAREGYGDSDGSPFPADDAQSCCFERGAVCSPASDGLRGRMVCKVCQENELCVLVLPCKHLCLCKACDAGVDTCPICHSQKNASLQIFMS